jgi:hypothetical protein
MTDFQPGQRIRLVHTSDPHTDLRPGDLGTVRHHDVHTHTVQITWDSGSSLSMLLDSGDRITATQPTAAQVKQRDDAMRAAVTAGAAAGRCTADWWCQHTVGGSATGDVRAAARRILAGIDDGDPAVLDTLPVCDRSDSTVDLDEVLDEHATAPEQPLTAAQRAAALDAYADAYDEAAEARVVELCHLATSPTGTDLTHLHPDRVDIGAVGVFSGDWALTPHDDGDRYTTGFVGTLLRRWNGWAVFACTRDVAEAIVADHEQQRGRLRDVLRDGGVADADLEQRVDAEAARLFFDGDVLVCDLRILEGDPQAIDRTMSDSDGRYVVMGGIWCWEPVDPYQCDHVVGDIPAPDDGERETVLRHTPQMRVPHDRLRLTAVQHRPTRHGLAFTGELTLDGVRVGTLTHDATDSGIDGGVDQYTVAFERKRRDVLAYLSGCRLTGAPVSLERLLHALTDEYYLDAAITQAAAGGGTQVRLVDDDGHTRALRLLIPAPRDYSELIQCARDLITDAPPVEAGQSWQVWTGTCWTTLPTTRT